jgi:nucleoid-associated protein YgaU
MRSDNPLTENICSGILGLDAEHMFAREGIGMQEQRTSTVKRRSILHGEPGERSRRGAFRFNFETAAFVISAFVLVVAGFTLTFPQGPCQALRPEPARTILVTVQPGDTIWGIARRISGENADLRRVVHEIAELNNLGDGVIRPGQGILVPAQPQQVAGAANGRF